jgi:hypothetical protein
VAELQHLLTLQQQIHRPAEPCPEFDLPSNRPFHDLACEAGVKNKRIGEFNRLTHVQMVA